MYLPSKITNILSKITKSYTVKYTNGKIESVNRYEKGGEEPCLNMF